MNINKARAQVETLLNDLIVHEALESDPVDVSTAKGWYDVKTAVSSILDLLTPVENKTSEAALVELKSMLESAGDMAIDYDFKPAEGAEAPTRYDVVAYDDEGGTSVVASMRVVIEEI